MKIDSFIMGLTIMSYIFVSVFLGSILIRWIFQHKWSNQNEARPPPVYTITPRVNPLASDPDYLDFPWEPAHRSLNVRETVKDDKDLPTYEEVMEMERGFASNRQTVTGSPNSLNTTQNSTRV